MRLDAVIFGGGAAGLWLLDRLSRQGCHVVLLEARALGSGQTIASQGIIHGGLKYTLQGLLTPAAKSVRGMPAVWRNALLGRCPPNLTHTHVRSECCHLWQTESLSSRAGMIGARLGLRVSPEVLAADERPEVLAAAPGVVARLAEQVISPESFLADLARQYHDRLLLVDVEQGLEFELGSPGEIEAIHLREPGGVRQLRLHPSQVVFAAGAGNARLRRLAGLDDLVMQRRPLQMVLARGPLPALNGHCIDGARTRVTITTDVDAQGRRVWQIGGQVAEDGVALSPQALTEHAQRELLAVLPGLSLDGVEWSTYAVDRAEGATANGARPEGVQVLCAGNVTTGWPTKLALAPVLADEIALRIAAEASSSAFDPTPFAAWPRPPVAQPPWEDVDRNWWTLTTAPARPVEPLPERRAA